MGGAVQLEQTLLARAAAVHAAMAALTETLREFDEADGWHGAGFRSIGHWADIHLGVASSDANRVAHAASRLPELPQLRAAFAEGAVSLDKVLAVARVATAATDARFTHMARAASVAQLQRICAEYRRATARDTAEEHEARRRRREVSARPVDDGLVRIVALLETDEAAIVLSALDCTRRGGMARRTAGTRRATARPGDAPS